MQSDTTMTFGELLLQWDNEFQSNNNNNAAKLTCVTFIDKMLTQDNLHQHINIDTIWFSIVGLLSSFMTTSNHENNPKVLDSAISYQYNYVTLFILQAASSKDKNLINNCYRFSYLKSTLIPIPSDNFIANFD